MSSMAHGKGRFKRQCLNVCPKRLRSKIPASLFLPIEPIRPQLQIYMHNQQHSTVARWPHGCRRQCSEVAVPALVGSNPTEGGGFFQGRNLRRAMDVCICLAGAHGRVVEGRPTLFRHHREVSRVRMPGRMGLPWMLCVVVFALCRPEKGKGEERVGVGGRGKYPGAPPHHIRKKEKNKPTVKGT
jgi:hypothetical protein